VLYLHPTNGRHVDWDRQKLVFNIQGETPKSRDYVADAGVFPATSGVK
jgi:hypothetical protein